ncbi:MAG: hypothetical protein IJQ79_02725 [Bacteroidales bacterium]|nr:hypothetical protein [Bacteroidales bacterium]
MDARCFYCGAELEWQKDEDTKEIFGACEENEGKVTSIWTCPDCGTEYLVTY